MAYFSEYDKQTRMSYFFRHMLEVVISYEHKCACTAIVQVYGLMSGTHR